MTERLKNQMENNKSPTDRKSKGTVEELISLRQSEFRYRTIFDRASVSMWEEDYTLVFRMLDRFRENGIQDIRKYLKTHPEAVDSLINQITVLDINDVTLRMYNAESKTQFLGSLHKVFLEESKSDFINQIATIYNGSNYFEGETTGKKISGEKMTLLIRIAVPELRGKADYTRVLVSLIDISERKKREQENLRLLQFAESMRASTLALTSTMDHDKILDTILEESRKLIHYTGVTIGLLQGEKIQIVRYKGSSDLSTKIEDFQEIYNHPDAYSVLTLKNDLKPLLIENTRKDPNWVPFPAASWVGSYLGIPLIVRGRFIGFINFYEKEAGVFSESAVHTLEPFVMSAAVALDNARLFREAEKEIEERKKAEEEIRKSLEEKKVLLMEIHHRVKNNLNIVASLLNLQTDQIETVEQAKRALETSQNRVHSMAMVHENLYRSDNLAHIEIGTYTRDMTAELLQLYETDTPITLRMETDSVPLPINSAVTFGLLLNELVTNAMLHAFTGKEPEGNLSIIIKKEGPRHCMLRVSDDGVGIPEDVMKKKSGKLGLQLIHILSQQLQGTSRFTNDNGGTSFEIRFPLDES